MFIPMNDEQAPIIGVDGNQSADILIVGDAPDGWAIREGRPFAHTIETILTQCLHQANMVKHDVCLTNLIWDDPKLDSYWRDKGHKGPSQLKKPIAKYVFRLEEIVRRVKPKVIVAMGDLTSFALTGKSGLVKIRGYPFMLNDVCVIPALHPRKMVYMNYEWRHYLAHDLQKAHKIAENPKLLTEPREQVIPQNWDHAVTLLSVIARWSTVCFDIEVSNYEISCVGFSSDKRIGISIPFDMRWTETEEVELWKLVAEILENPRSKKVIQNGIFDCQFLAMRNGIFVRQMNGESLQDTMIAHHIMYPDFLKGLGFLGSIYTFQPYWKDEMKFKGINKEG